MTDDATAWLMGNSTPSASFLEKGRTYEGRIVELRMVQQRDFERAKAARAASGVPGEPRGGRDVSGHTFVFYLDGGVPEFRVECGYGEDPTRPCRTFSCDHFGGEHDESCVVIDGCGVSDWLDAGGYEAITASGFEARVPLALSWHPEGWPIIEPAGVPGDPQEPNDG